VLTAAGIRLSELAGRRYDPGGPRSSGIDLWQREITVRGTGGNAESHLYPHRFRRHFSHTWPDRGGPGADQMELAGWASPQMLTRYRASARSARARRTHDRHIRPPSAAPAFTPATPGSSPPGHNSPASSGAIFSQGGHPGRPADGPADTQPAGDPSREPRKSVRRSAGNASHGRQPRGRAANPPRKPESEVTAWPAA
jgi:hypothetical protein